MALLTRSRLVGARLDERTAIIKTASARVKLIKEAQAPLERRFDVFLSHSSSDAAEVLAVKELFEEMGYTVYVDWVEDGEMNRGNVSPATAAQLRHRISRSRSLLVHASSGAKLSRWVPWELGFADGHGRRVGILPVVDLETNSYSGNEYLGLYPYIDVAETKGGGSLRPWANRDASTYVAFDEWLNGKEPTLRTG